VATTLKLYSNTHGHYFIFLNVQWLDYLMIKLIVAKGADIAQRGKDEDERRKNFFVHSKHTDHRFSGSLRSVPVPRIS